MNPLFAERLRREELLALPPATPKRELCIAVHRNHSFELVASVMPPFLALSRAAARFHYSAYDDSLSFGGNPPEADLHLVWVDAARYSLPDVSGWLGERITALRNSRPGKVLVAWIGAPNAVFPPLTDTLYVNGNALLAPLGHRAFDARLEGFTGTRLSNEACLVLARELGARYIPALLFPALKAVAVDMDNTLYAGILGEDGINRVRPYPDVQRRLAELAKQGFLLALTSKNEEEDARALFAARKDFFLQWDDFSAFGVNWKPKTENIRRMAAELRIGLEGILFVDDNPGERLHVASVLPEIRVLEADGPEETARALHYFPGLMKTAHTPEDGLRSADLRANARRDGLRRSLDREAYLRRLAVTLRLAVNPEERRARVNELLHKTNQFIVSLARPSQAEVDGYFSASDKCVITASMADALSDSGLISVGLFSRQEGALRVDELVVSCRALGRGIEKGMAASMLALAAKALNAKNGVRIVYARGPRNSPALDWLASLVHGEIPGGLREKGVVCLDGLPEPDLPGVTVREDTLLYGLG